MLSLARDKSNEAHPSSPFICFTLALNVKVKSTYYPVPEVCLLRLI
jgi:hypothetical protein